MYQLTRPIYVIFLADNVTRIFGEWKGSNAAGCDHDTLFKNPKFIVDVSAEGRYISS